MNTIARFVDGLKARLQGTDAYCEFRRGQGGCDTCGYGAEEINALDFEKLCSEIDKFSAEFQSVTE
jgi:hypothetical protein